MPKTERELIKEETNWALHRTLLANERTFNAWLRTGITGMAAGLGIAKLLESLLWPGFLKSIGFLLIAIGVIACGLGIYRYRQISRTLSAAGSDPIPDWLFLMMAGLLSLAALFSIVLLFEV